MYGGGITSGSMGTISECLIGSNNADDGGGGISIHSGSLSIDHCILRYNKCYTSQGKGGGIYTVGEAVMVDHFSFFENEVNITTNAKGQEIHTEGNAAITITNSIIISLWNSETIVFGSSSPASVSYSDFLGEVGISANYIYGNMPSGLGEITTTNNNGDPSDVYFNIFKDPLFENPYSGNFQITWSNFPTNDETKSPCIDAGVPAFTDPDRTISDIGALFYSQPPGADFEADIIQGEVPLTVQFNDKSIGELTSWMWDFGDGNTSTEGNPSYTYNIAGVYTIKLTVSGPKGTDSETKTDYITVSDITNIETEEMGDILRIYPNPANISCTLSLSLKKSDNVKLAVYNSQGQMVIIIFDGLIPAEIYYLEADISDLPGGIYFISVSTDSYSKIQKLIITK
jgi:PKD repeat protein